MRVSSDQWSLKQSRCLSNALHPLPLLAFITAFLLANVVVAVPAPPTPAPGSDTFTLSASDVNSLDHCQPDPPPTERPPDQQLERFATVPAEAGIELHGFYDPLHLYLCTDGFDTRGTQIMHAASEIEIFDWSHHVILHSTVHRPPEYDGKVQFYFLSEKDWKEGRFVIEMRGTFGGKWRDLKVMVQKEGVTVLGEGERLLEGEGEELGEPVVLRI